MRELSVSDGFRFGCGFFIAGLVAWLVMVMIVFLLTFAFGTFFDNVFQDLLGTMGQLFPVMALV
jgi:hypothetical protein